MDKDRIDGSAKQAAGALKQAAGKVTGDAKLKSEGAAERAQGKVQGAVVDKGTYLGWFYGVKSL